MAPTSSLHSTRRYGGALVLTFLVRWANGSDLGRRH